MINTETEDVVVATLKKRYFDVVSKENYPNTPQLTQEADNLEGAIRELMAREHTKPPNDQAQRPLADSDAGRKGKHD